MAQDSPSPVELIKIHSNFLRGTLAEELENEQEAFAKDSAQLIKHHGMYQQDDRDARTAKTPGGKSQRTHSLMVRVKLPGGKLDSPQLLGMLDLADELAAQNIRLTNRQDIQVHVVRKRHVRQFVRRVNELGLTTLGACGDVTRNVLCCPAPLRQDAMRDQMQQLADAITGLLLPRTPAYREIWLKDSPAAERYAGSGSAEVEPLYGETYLPRKFKVAIALASDNCIDAYANDVGLVAIAEDARISGYNVVVGGGFGVTLGKKDTFPAIAQKLTFVEPGEVLPLVTAVVRVQRDFGCRTDRRRARMKYLIADWGLPRFQAQVEEYYGRKLPAPHPAEVSGFDDHLGWHAQGDGRWFYGLNVENGRVLDREGFQLKAALREICQRYRPGLRVTAHQSLLFIDLPADARSGIEEILRRCGVPTLEQISAVRRWSMACVAKPTCPLAVAESERVMPGLVDQLERELEQLGLGSEVFTTRMTGCPNGCARPYNADVGLSGRTLGKYTIYLGGRLLGDRLGFVYKDIVPLDQIVATLRPVLMFFKDHRSAGETLGDFCHRIGPAGLHAATGEPESSRRE
jgi:sulfite reductase (ferredoxin)